jgi:hypothetical protein
MPRSLDEQVKRLTALALSQSARLTLLDITIRSLLSTHPRPDRLRAVFERAGTRFLDRAVASRLSEEALLDVQGLYQTYLSLIDKAPRDPSPRQDDP